MVGGRIFVEKLKRSSSSHSQLLDALIRWKIDFELAESVQKRLQLSFGRQQQHGETDKTILSVFRDFSAEFSRTRQA